MEERLCWFLTAPLVPLRVLKQQNVGAEILTLNLQVLLSLEVFDCRMIHDADDRNAVILPADGEGQPAGHCVHLIIGQLNSGFPCEQAEARGVRRGRPETVLQTVMIFRTVPDLDRSAPG